MIDPVAQSCLYSMYLEDVTIVPTIFLSLIESHMEKSTNTTDTNNKKDGPSNETEMVILFQ